MKYLRGLFIAAVIIGAWFLFSQKMNPLFLPKPAAVWNNLVELYKNGMLWRSTQMSFMRITTSIIIASLVSIPLGLAVSNYSWFEKIINPITNAPRYIPVTVFFPLLIMWAGIGEPMKIAFLSIASFLFLLPAIVMSIKETPRDLVDTAYTMGMGSWKVMLGVLLPYSLPAILQNLLLAYSVGWTYVIIVETVNPVAGLGFLINIGSARGRTDLVFASILVIIVIGVIFDLVGKKLIHWLFPWKFAREISG